MSCYIRTVVPNTWPVGCYHIVENMNVIGIMLSYSQSMCLALHFNLGVRTCLPTQLIDQRTKSGVPTAMEQLEGECLFTSGDFESGRQRQRIHMRTSTNLWQFRGQVQELQLYELAADLWRLTDAPQLSEFVRRLVLTQHWDNDMHLKNWSLIYPRAYAAAAPAYDFVQRSCIFQMTSWRCRSPRRNPPVS